MAVSGNTSGLEVRAKEEVLALLFHFNRPRDANAIGMQQQTLGDRPSHKQPVAPPGVCQTVDCVGTIGRWSVSRVGQ
jgi:hypothetical protein